MKRAIKYIIVTSFFATILVSCSNEVSLQRYFVDSQESKDFITQDIPITMVGLDQSKFSKEQKEAYNSIKRLNFLGFKSKETNAETYEVELAKVKAILSDSKYNDLIEVSDKGRKIVVKYVGTDDKADEVVVLGSSKALGFAVVRVLGDDMSPAKMGTLIRAIQKADFDENQVKDIMGFFK